MYSPQPLLSISCVTYNHAKYIRQALDSFLMQKTNFLFEIIIHDDASTDGTREIIEEYQSRYPELIFPMFQEENQYSKGIRGIGFRYNYPRCRGKYIALCEGDDYWTDPSKLQKQVDFLENNIDYAITYHDVKVIDDEGKTIMESQLPDIYKRDSDKQELITGDFWIKTLTICYRNVISKEIPIEYSKVINGDTFFVSLIGNYGKGKWMGDVIEQGIYRMHQGGIWSAKTEIEKAVEHVNTFHWIFRYYYRINQIENARVWHQKLIIKSNELDYLLERGIQPLSFGDEKIHRGMSNKQSWTRKIKEAIRYRLKCLMASYKNFRNSKKTF